MIYLYSTDLFTLFLHLIQQMSVDNRNVKLNKYCHLGKHTFMLNTCKKYCFIFDVNLEN